MCRGSAEARVGVSEGRAEGRTSAPSVGHGASGPISCSGSTEKFSKSSNWHSPHVSVTGSSTRRMPHSTHLAFLFSASAVSGDSRVGVME